MFAHLCSFHRCFTSLGVSISKSASPNFSFVQLVSVLKQSVSLQAGLICCYLSSPQNLTKTVSEPLGSKSRLKDKSRAPPEENGNNAHNTARTPDMCYWIQA